MEKFLQCISNFPDYSLAKDKQNKLSIYDYWDYLYYDDLDFYGQLAVAMDRINQLKANLELNFKESLIVRVPDIHSEKIVHVLEKINNIKRDNYMPLILFLCDNYNDEELTTEFFDDKKYPNIDKRMVYFTKFEDDLIDENKTSKIKRILERFCSYHNELGDRFTIGSDKNEICYDLTEKNFPFTINICCVGRFGKGKSTGVNYLLGEKKAKENKSGTAATKRINFYQVSKFPLKIYDLPGFENHETVKNAINKFKYLNNEIRRLQDQIHIILYFIKSTDERMFSQMEFGMFKQILLHKDAFVLYVLTHSSEKTDRNEIYDMINTGIKGVIDSKRKKYLELNKSQEIFEKIYLKMFASADNCIFVNFHPTPKLKLYGISNYFEKISKYVELTDAYHKFQKNFYLSEDEFHKKIVEEAQIRKIRAKDILRRHRIGSAVAGLLPGVDFVLNNYVIKKDAVIKAGEVFGFDLNIMNEIKKQQEKKNNKNNNQETNPNNLININNSDTPGGDEVKLENVEKEEELIKDENTINISSNNSTELIEDENKNILDFEKEKKIIEKKKQKDKDNKIKYGGMGVSYFSTVVSTSTSASRFLLAAGSVGLMAVSITFTFIGSAVSSGLGYYLMGRHCEDLLEQFVNLFIQNADHLSDSLLLGINYLKQMAQVYKDQGF